MRTTSLIRIALCVATLAAAGAARAAIAEAPAPGDGRAQADAACQRAGVQADPLTPTGLPTSATRLARQRLGGGVMGTDDLKLVFACSGQSAPQV